MCERKTAKAVGSRLEDPVLQALFDCLEFIARPDKDVRDIFITRMSRHLGIFLPQSRAGFVAAHLLDGNVALPQPAFPVSEAHRCFLAVSLADAINDLPAGLREAARERMVAMEWTRSLTARADEFRTGRCGDSTCLHLSCGANGKDGVILRGDVPGVLRVLFAEDHCLVTHNAPDPASIRFSGLPWPGGHTLWLKGSDWVQVADQRLTRDTLKFLHGQQSINPISTPLSWNAGRILAGAEDRGVLGHVVGQAGWMLRAENGAKADPDSELRLNGAPLEGAMPLLPEDTVTIGGRPLRAKRLLGALVRGLPDSSWRVVIESLGVVFPDGQIGLDDLTLTLENGDLVAVMGPSGCGKSTMVSVLSGELRAAAGGIRIERAAPSPPVFAVVPQDDVLFPELTVRENLAFARSLRRRPEDASGDDRSRVEDALDAVGLTVKSGLRVGNVTAKVLSGGERKRLNVGLELVGNPDALLLDEPTSGLSSADADQMMALLRSRANQGMLVLAVIHQPSQEIFDGFDKVIVLDVGGKLAFFGDPASAKGYFQVHVPGAAIKEWTPDRILDALIGRWSTLDESSNRRVFGPEFWKMRYQAARRRLEPVLVDTMGAMPAIPHGASGEGNSLPLWAKMGALLRREAVRKRREWKSFAVGCLVAGALALLIGWVCRSTADGEEYSYSENSNLVAFYFLASILMGFLALATSTQEMVRDASHRLRERLLRVPAPAWLVAKLPALILLIIVQAAIITVCGSFILQIPHGHAEAWISLSLMGICCGVLGLLISSLPGMSERIALSLVPLLLVPQMMLAGSFPFTFSEIAHLNWSGAFTPAAEENSDSERSEVNAPWITHLMPAKWSYQAMVCAMRDAPEIALPADQNEMLSTYNRARTHAELWREDPVGFLSKMEEATRRRLSEAQIREEISFVHRLGLRATGDIEHSFGDLVDAPSWQHGNLARIRNVRLLYHAENDLPYRSALFGLKLSPASAGWLVLALASVLLFAVASAVSLISPRRVIDARSLLRSWVKRSPKPPEKYERSS